MVLIAQRVAEKVKDECKTCGRKTSRQTISRKMSEQRIT
jgi:rRNA maturation endonuclease Nob1